MSSSYQHYYNYLAEHVITPFYNVRLEGLQSLRLSSILKRKNPYLFKAKNIELAGDLIKSVVDAFLSSQEETIFGNLLEGFAIYISNVLCGGFKSGDDNLYREIISPIDKEARLKDETFKRAYAAKVNEMTQDFTANFMTPENQIDWIKLIDYVSKRD